MCKPPGPSRYLVNRQVLPQTLAVLQTRAEPVGITLELVDAQALGADAASGDSAGEHTQAEVLRLGPQSPGKAASTRDT